MSSGQTLLVIASFILLSTLTLSVNEVLISTTTLGLEMEVNLDALSVGQTLLDEILSREFDQHTTGGKRVFSYDELTLPGALGPDGGDEVIAGSNGIDTSSTGAFESKVKFDDVDDYHNYRRSVWNQRLGWFTLTSTVQYVDEDDLDLVLSSRTFCKKVTVTVTHPNMVKGSTGQIVPLVMKDVAVYRRYF